jgi:hypothetical protein
MGISRVSTTDIIRSKSDRYNSQRGVLAPQFQHLSIESPAVRPRFKLPARRGRVVLVHSVIMESDSQDNGLALTAIAAVGLLARHRNEAKGLKRIAAAGLR